MYCNNTKFWHKIRHFWKYRWHTYFLDTFSIRRNIKPNVQEMCALYYLFTCIGIFIEMMHVDYVFAFKKLRDFFFRKAALYEHIYICKSSLAFSRLVSIYLLNHCLTLLRSYLSLNGKE